MDFTTQESHSDAQKSQESYLFDPHTFLAESVPLDFPKVSQR
jgi:hypothetical protein